MRTTALIIAAVMILSVAAPWGTASAQEINVTIRDHKFEPTELRVPANKRVTVYVTNEDATPEEFESNSLKVEKIIPGKSKGLVRIGPLAPGRYDFFGDFHQDTAKGVVIAE
jgi:Cupredoxin-like domain